MRTPRSRAGTDSSRAALRATLAGLVDGFETDDLSVTTGTVNDAALLARGVALGVDAIATDRPAALRRELAAMSLAA